MVLASFDDHEGREGGRVRHLLGVRDVLIIIHYTRWLSCLLTGLAWEQPGLNSRIFAIL
jgi:hypothetical protein